MARSKASLFEEDEQLSSCLFHALGHPARIRMTHRLLNKGPISYSELILDIPLAEGTITQHLNIMKKADLLAPAVLADGSVGYKLNKEVYQTCAEAGRRQLRVAGLPRRLGKVG